MSRTKPKTEGFEWLILSLRSFNGSGYADMQDPQSFLESYRAYNLMRNRPRAVTLSRQYERDALDFLDTFLRTTYGAGRVPPDSSLARFNTFRQELMKQGKLL